MIKYLPFISQTLIVIGVIWGSKKIKDKKARKFFLLMIILPQIPVFIGYLKVFFFMYGNK